MLRLLLLFTVASCFIPAAVAANATESGGWSADVLDRILKADPTRPEVSSVAPAPEMALRTYHLSHLQIGEAGRSKNVLSILEKLLPAGSYINQDVPANSVHVLTTPAAHKAVWDYLSAVDIAESTPPVATAAVPDDVKVAIKKLADSNDQAAKLFSAIDAMKADVAQGIAAIDNREHDRMVRLAIVGITCLVVGSAVLGWMLRRRPVVEKEVPNSNTGLVIAPEQLTTALTPVHDRMRTDMLGMLNEVAIKLQAQHNEQQKLVHEQQHQLESARLALAEERRQFISETGTMVVQAVERVDATTAKLARQQDKVTELVQELQNTVRELDDTKDSLRNKEIELEQERAKIAALSMLLEEGGTAPAVPNIHRSPRSNGHSAPSFEPEVSPPSALPSTLCTNHDPTVTTPMDLTPHPIGVAASQMPRFQFVPPDHPET